MIDCSAYLDAKRAHTSQAMMKCSAALLVAANSYAAAGGAQIWTVACKTSKPSIVCVFFVARPTSVQTLPAVDFTSTTAAKHSRPELLAAEWSAVGRAKRLAYEVTARLKLCIGEFATHIRALWNDSTQNEPIAAKLESVRASGCVRVSESS